MSRTTKNISESVTITPVTPRPQEGARRGRINSRPHGKTRQRVVPAVTLNVTPPVLPPLEKTFKPTSVFRDLADWANAFLHPVAKHDESLIQFCVAKGIPHRLVEKPDNAHSIAHVCRDEAVRLIIRSEGRGKTELTILDWFGGGRNLRFDPRNGPFGKVSVRGKLISSKDVLKIHWTMAPDDAIAGDNSRNLANCKVPLVGTFDVAIVQDVYQDGPTALDQFSPSTVLRIAAHVASGHVYIANRLFVGDAGADDLGFGKKEQAFYRDEDGLIVSSPDPFSTPYAKHPDTNWVCESRSFGGVDLVPLNTVGPYFLVRASVGRAGAQHLGPTLVRQPKFLRVDLYSGSWWNWSLSWIGWHRRPVLIHYPTVASLGLKFAVKSPNGQILDSLIGAVIRDVESDIQCTVLRERFPVVMKDLVNGTVQACLHAERKNTTNAFLALRKFNVSAEHNLAVVRASTAPPQSRWRRRFLICVTGVGLAAVGSVFFFRNLASATSAFVLASPSVSRFSNGFCHLLTEIRKVRVTTGAYLLTAFPMLSAGLEEALASFSETAAGFGSVKEFIFNVKTNPLGATATLVMQAFLSLLRSYGVGGRILALAVHVGWNCWATQVPVIKRFQEFLKSYSDGEKLGDKQRVWEPIPAGTTFPAYQTKISLPPAKFRGKVQVWVDHVAVTIPEAFELLDGDVDPKGGLFPVLVTNRLLHQPANTAKNLLAAVVHRLHADPFVDNPHSEVQRHAEWVRLAEIVIENGLLIPFCELQLTRQECFSLMGKKGPRLERAWDDVLYGRSVNTKKTINLKWNETLTIEKEVDGVFTMKPRAIQNLVPEIHAFMAPTARVLNFIMHESFDGRICYIGGRAIRIIFASGSTGAELNRIGNLLLDGVFTIVVSGDDSVVSFGNESRDGASFGEADQSAFDHTQDDGPCLHFQKRIQQYLGFDSEFTDVAYQACSSGYTARKGRLFMRGECGTQMPTGITTTTTFNSMATAMMWVFWFLHKDLSVVEAGRRLGFKVKYEPRADLCQATFLKGWWLTNSFGGVEWFPLPSACVKLGKLLKDPQEITAVKRRGKKVQLEYVEAVRRCAYALSMSYQTVPQEYPIFGAFLGVLRRLSKASPGPLATLEEGYKPVVETIGFSRGFALEAMVSRYGISVQDICDVELLLSKITQLPAYIEHDVFDALAEVDYN